MELEDDGAPAGAAPATRTRRDVVRKAVVGGGVALAAPTVRSWTTPAFAVSDASIDSVSFTSPPPPDGVNFSQDAVSQPSVCAGPPLPNYSAGDASPKFSYSVVGSGPVTGDEFATIEVTGLPRSGTCTIHAQAACDRTPPPPCSPIESTVKADGDTSATVIVAFNCGIEAFIERGFSRVYISVGP